MTSLFSFIIVLGLLIFVHEFGHFLFAKLFRVKVQKFSLGFGPKLIGRQQGETEYLISAFPLGGYVKMLGEQGDDEIPQAEAHRSFAGKKVWQRFLIVAGGPTFNLLFAVLLFFLVFLIAGLPQPVDNTVIGGVSLDSPANQAGLIAGDRIQMINGQAVDKWEEVANLIGGSNGEPVILIIDRNGEELNITATPKLTEDHNLFGETVGQRYMLGIARSDEVVYEKISPVRALLAGFSQTWSLITLTLMGVWKMIQSVIPASELGGPILIAQLAGKQMEAGWINLIYFMGLISVNLGILNLFPIPVLDGGHLMFFTYEAIFRKPVPKKAQEISLQAGLVILISLMVFVFYNDISRLIAGAR
ncbi:MAG: RIP metalloprotease RseP [Proteobacteria bacterium]|nr:RIP metalloprotease RseP [Pseudomonadota bacterium]MBU1687758.1 RIP metalloprotease RseP [Pseudomonadota bacterium]